MLLGSWKSAGIFRNQESGNRVLFSAGACVCVPAGVCRGASAARVNATVDDAVVTLSDLQPDTPYHIHIFSVPHFFATATSQSAVSQSGSVLLSVKTGHTGLSAGHVAALVILACLLVGLSIATVSFGVRYLHTL